jgi:hypothetical protein
MSEQSWNTWFDFQLEQLTTNGKVPNLASVQTKDTPPADLVDDLFIAARLADLNLDQGTEAKAMLRTRLAWIAMAKLPNTRNRVRPELPDQVRFHFRISRMIGLVTIFLAVFLTAFSQPALEMAQHLLGYGYLPEVGFFPLSKALLLKGPVELQQNQQPVLIQQGISLQSGPTAPGITWLWVEGDPNVLNMGETWLNLAGGKQLPVQSIKRLGDNQTRLEFGTLPLESTQSVLKLAGGIKIPFAWIPATEAGLAPTQVYSMELTQTPTGKATMMPCLKMTEQLMLCAQAAYGDSQGTHLLLELQPIQNGMSVQGNIKMINQAELRDENQQFYPLGAFVPGIMDGKNVLTLQFNPIPDGIANVTLHLSGILIQQDGKEVEVTGPFDLALHLPDREEMVSPTPSVIQSSEWQPVPTPVITSRP